MLGEQKEEEGRFDASSSAAEAALGIEVSPPRLGDDPSHTAVVAACHRGTLAAARTSFGPPRIGVVRSGLAGKLEKRRKVGTWEVVA